MLALFQYYYLITHALTYRLIGSEGLKVVRFFENKGHWKIVKMAARYIGDLLNLENYSAKSFRHGNPRKISTSKIGRYTVILTKRWLLKGFV